jgi:hypothetical protein
MPPFRDIYAQKAPVTFEGSLAGQDKIGKTPYMRLQEKIKYSLTLYIKECIMHALFGCWQLKPVSGKPTREIVRSPSADRPISHQQKWNVHFSGNKAPSSSLSNEQTSTD